MKIMKDKNEKCVVCGKELEKDEGEVCKTCYNVLKLKYPKNKNFKKSLKCHKKQTKKLKEI